MIQIKSIPAEEALNYIDQNKDTVQIIDVRMPREYRERALEDALNIPIQVLQHNLEKLEKDKEIICYCLHGVRSGQAAHFLISKGFTKVSHIEGGLSEIY